MILAAEGERDARIARAEGEAQAIYLAKKAEADGLLALKEAGADAAVFHLVANERDLRHRGGDITACHGIGIQMIGGRHLHRGGRDDGLQFFGVDGLFLRKD